MGETATSLIEIGVGVACGVVGAGMWRAARRRWMAIVLLGAGALAVGHGVVAIVG